MVEVVIVTIPPMDRFKSRSRKVLSLFKHFDRPLLSTWGIGKRDHLLGSQVEGEVC